MIEGIKSKKQIKSYYDQYERVFPYDPTALEEKFDATVAVISSIFQQTLRSSEFRRIHVFYSLFTAIYHMQFGLPELGLARQLMQKSEYSRVRSILEHIETIFETDELTLDKEERRFLEDSRRATTDTTVRVRRTKFIVERLLAQ